MSVLTMILAGGEGNRLSILGEKRVKPAVPFGGKYRIIDFPLSNVVNSDLYRVAVLTQYRPHSLMRAPRHRRAVGPEPPPAQRPPDLAALPRAPRPGLVPGHRRCAAPKPQFDRRRRQRPAAGPLRRPHLQAGLPRFAPLSPGKRGRSHRRGDGRARRRGPSLRNHERRRRPADHPVRRKAEAVRQAPWRPWVSMFSTPPFCCGGWKKMPRIQPQSTTLAKTSFPRWSSVIGLFAYPFSRLLG